nr:nucleotide-binding, alpha-beta plait [Tanacetum cinerariifolium]
MLDHNSTDSQNGSKGVEVFVGGLARTLTEDKVHKNDPRMPYEQLAEFLEESCGCYFQGLYYQVPSQDLEWGLVRVSDDDRSTSYMFDVEETFGRLTLYLDHLDIDLSEYLSKAITYDMYDLVSKKIGPPKK